MLRGCRQRAAVNPPSQWRHTYLSDLTGADIEGRRRPGEASLGGNCVLI